MSTGDRDRVLKNKYPYEYNIESWNLPDYYISYIKRWLKKFLYIYIYISIYIYYKQTLFYLEIDSNITSRFRRNSASAGAYSLYNKIFIKKFYNIK
jgi:hypothetical protein